jgi:hypothetical protein
MRLHQNAGPANRADRLATALVGADYGVPGGVQRQISFPASVPK